MFETRGFLCSKANVLNVQSESVKTQLLRLKGTAVMPTYTMGFHKGTSRAGAQSTPYPFKSPRSLYVSDTSRPLSSSSSLERVEKFALGQGVSALNGGDCA